MLHALAAPHGEWANLVRAIVELREHGRPLARGALTAQMPPRLHGDVWMTSTMYNPSAWAGEAVTDYARALAHYTATGDRGGMAFAMEYLGARKIDIDAHDPEGWRLLEESAVLASAAGDTLVEHSTLIQLSWEAMRSREYDRAESTYREAIRLCRETGDLFYLSSALVNLGFMQMERLRFRDALPNLQQGADAARLVNNSLVELNAECFAADIIRYLGDAPRAVALGEANLAFARDKFPPSLRYQGVPVGALTKALNDAGEHDRAHALLVGWFSSIHKMEGGLQVYRIWHGIEILGCVAMGRGDAWRAARLFGIADASYLLSGQRRYQHNEMEIAPYVAEARAALGDPAFEAARAEGRAMTPEQAIAYALQGEEADELIDQSRAE